MNRIKSPISNIINSKVFMFVNIVLFLLFLSVIVMFGKAMEGLIGLISVFMLVITLVFIVDSFISRL
ncbi:MAG: hypothetical protein ABGF52_09340 [Candidatus Asgardarchaeum sp.]